MKKLSVLALLAAVTLPSWAGFEQCASHFPLAKPVTLKEAPDGRSQLRELCFDSFAVLYSGQSKTPVFVVERLNRARLLDAKDEERTNKFYAEARLPSAMRAQLEDYKATIIWHGVPTHFDRGHMAPAADMPNAESMAQSFSLANMVPQAPVNNRKVWSGLEKATRQYVMRAPGDVFVFSGPAYDKDVVKVGPGQVWVPERLFKLVYDVTNRRAWAYWVDNLDSAKAGKPLPYKEFVRRTGLDPLPGNLVSE